MTMYLLYVNDMIIVSDDALLHIYCTISNVNLVLSLSFYVI